MGVQDFVVAGEGSKSVAIQACLAYVRDILRNEKVYLLEAQAKSPS